jgi:hypothetical protein
MWRPGWSSIARQSAEQVQDSVEGSCDCWQYAEEDEGGEEAQAEGYDGSGFDGAGVFFDGPASCLAGVVGQVFEGSRQGGTGAKGAAYGAGQGCAGWFCEEIGPGVDRVDSQG